MTAEIRAAEELAAYHVVSVDQAMQLIEWSQERFQDDWETVAGAMGELADQGITVEEMLDMSISKFWWKCLFHGVWLPHGEQMQIAASQEIPWLREYIEYDEMLQKQQADLGEEWGL